MPSRAPGFKNPIGLDVTGPDGPRRSATVTVLSAYTHALTACRPRGRSARGGVLMETVAALRSIVAGEVIGPDDPGFDEARAIWNGMIDRRPAAIVRAGGVGDIAPTIGAARALGLPIAVRGGGHNVAGNGTVEGGIVLDLGGLTAVAVDATGQVVRVAPG